MPRRPRQLADAELDTRSCSAPVENRNGELACNPPAQAFPVGSWARSCRNAAMNGSLLNAECQTANGGWRAAVIDVAACDLPVENRDGALVCAPPPPAPVIEVEDLPPGSYQQSCRNASAAGGFLSAECADQARARSCRRRSTIAPAPAISPIPAVS